MKNLLTILVLIFVTFESFSQNDTLQLFDSYILFRGQEYNRTINGVKQGKWIYYTIDVNESLYALGSGYDPKSGKETHSYVSTDFEYRPLEAFEKEGERRVLSSEIDTTFGDVRYHISRIIVYSKVPSKFYYITSRGNYINDLKTGKWTSYYRTGAVKKEIEYINGLPTTGFKIFRENGVIMFDVIRLNNTDWNICRHSETGKLLDCELKKIDEFRRLYE